MCARHESFRPAVRRPPQSRVGRSPQRRKPWSPGAAWEAAAIRAIEGARRRTGAQRGTRFGVRLAVAGHRQPVERLSADRDVPGRAHPADRTAPLRLVVDRRPLLRLRRQDRPVPGRVDHADLAGRPVPRRPALPPRARPRLPQPGAHRQDGGHPAGAVRRSLHPRHRRRLARGRVPLLRLRLPRPAGALRPTRGGRPDLPADVDRGATRRFEGTYFRIDDAAAPPRPDPMPPICIGASGEKIGLPLVGPLGRHLERHVARHRRRLAPSPRHRHERRGRRPGATRPTSRSAPPLERALPETDADSAALVRVPRKASTSSACDTSCWTSVIRSPPSPCSASPNR